MFKKFLSSHWHLKYWSNGWEILQIDRNYAVKGISVFLSISIYTSLKTSEELFLLYLHKYEKKMLVNLYNHKLLESKKDCFILFSSSLNDFSTMMLYLMKA